MPTLLPRLKKTGQRKRKALLTFTAGAEKLMSRRKHTNTDTMEHITSQETESPRQHIIPVGTLVEIVDPFDDLNGIRLYVVGHHRDYDGTPLYALGRKGAEMWDDGRFFPGARFGKYHNPRTIHGISEKNLIVIKP